MWLAGLAIGLLIGGSVGASIMAIISINRGEPDECSIAPRMGSAETSDAGKSPRGTDRSSASEEP